MELKVQRANAIRAHRNGGKEVKTTLENIFGAEIFNQDPTERIKTFEDALAELNLKREDVLPYLDPKTPRQVRANAREMLDVIAEALRNGIELDFNDSSQKKWRVWFEKRSGVGFVVADANAYWSNARTDVGSRLSLQDEKTALYFGNQFLDLHNIVLANPTK